MLCLLCTVPAFHFHGLGPYRLSPYCQYMEPFNFNLRLVIQLGLLLGHILFRLSSFHQVIFLAHTANPRVLISHALKSEHDKRVMKGSNIFI